MSEPDQGESPSRAMSSGDDRRLDFRPGMGMWWKITRSTEDRSGELFEATNKGIPPEGTPPLPGQTSGVSADAATDVGASSRADGGHRVDSPYEAC